MGASCSERAMLAELVRLIRERDPDVIEGHNIYAFDLAYLMARCERYGVPFAIGRDGSVPRTFTDEHAVCRAHAWISPPWTSLADTSSIPICRC